MNHLLEVREFETIISNPDYKTEYAYLPDDIFGSLEDFIHEYTSAEGGSDVLEFLKVGYKRNLGRTISVNNYVGLIQMKYVPIQPSQPNSPAGAIVWQTDGSSSILTRLP